MPAATNSSRGPRLNDHNFVFLLCVLFYFLAISYGVVTVQQYLIQPELRRKASFKDTIFRTGDLILWSSDFKWYTDLEKIACGSRFTHVGIVFVDKAERVFLWESDAKPGHAITPLLDLLKKFETTNCTSVLRKLNHPLDSKKFEQYILNNLGNGYSFKLWDAVVNRWLHRMRLPCLLVPETNTELSCLVKKRFCSELVADTYHHMGVINLSLGEKSNAALILPGDFSIDGQSGICGELLYWVPPYALGPEIKLTLH